MMFSEDRHGRHTLVAPLRSITAPLIGIDRREMSPTPGEWIRKAVTGEYFSVEPLKIFWPLLVAV
jgi:hypothetical protein